MHRACFHWLILASGFASAISPVETVHAATPAISLGWLHSCAIDSNGSAFCWGDNNNGQLGDGTIGAAVKLDVLNLAGGMAAVDAGAAHTCALTTAGGVKCWGRNDEGELGDGTNITRVAPADVRNLASSVSRISAGDQFTCAVTSGGGIKCWGANYGNLGDGLAAARPLSRTIAISALDTSYRSIAVGGVNSHWVIRRL